MKSKDLAAMLRTELGPTVEVTAPFPKQVVVYGADDRYNDFTFQGVSVEFRPRSAKPPMFDRPYSKLAVVK